LKWGGGGGVVQMFHFNILSKIVAILADCRQLSGCFPLPSCFLLMSQSVIEHDEIFNEITNSAKSRNM